MQTSYVSALDWAATQGRKETVPKIFAVRAAFPDLYPRVRGAVELALDFYQQGVACKIVEHSAVDVNTRGSAGMTLLNHAAVVGAQKFARFLLSKGADVNTTCEAGKTPLRHAISGGHEGMVRLLAEHGAPVNSLPTGPCKDCEMGTKKHRCHPPLHQAAECYNSQVVRALLEKGADPNLLSSDGLRPIHVAALCGASNILEELIAASDVNCRDDWYHRTALHIAVKGRNETGIRVLLKAEGIDVNAKDCHYRTPLFLAVQQGDAHLVALLLDAPGIDIFVKTRWRQTALSKSVVQSWPDIEEMLWDKVKELSKK